MGWFLPPLAFAVVSQMFHSKVKKKKILNPLHPRPGLGVSKSWPARKVPGSLVYQDFTPEEMEIYGENCIYPASLRGRAFFSKWG